MECKLEEIDEILASYEDWMHGTDGENCTKARKLLGEVQQQLKILNIPVVSKTFTAEFVVNELEDCEHLDEAIMHFKQQM